VDGVGEIYGVSEMKLDVHVDERGYLMEILRSDDPNFRKFGQCYVTATYDGAIKGFHLHKEQWDYIVCVHGMVKVFIYDGREDSPTYGTLGEYHIGVRRPRLLIIPPDLWHGWKAYDGLALAINVPTELYNYREPDEYRMNPHSPIVDAHWDRVDR